MSEGRKKSDAKFWAWMAVAFLIGAIAGMNGAVVAVLLVAFAAFCIWLAVLIIVREKRWAKQMAFGIALFLVSYPLSVGPIGWLGMRLSPELLREILVTVYLPLFRLRQSGFSQSADVFEWYLRLWGLIN